MSKLKRLHTFNELKWVLTWFPVVQLPDLASHNLPDDTPAIIQQNPIITCKLKPSIMPQLELVRKTCLPCRPCWMKGIRGVVLFNWTIVGYFGIEIVLTIFLSILASLILIAKLCSTEWLPALAWFDCNYISSPSPSQPHRSLTTPANSLMF